MTEESQVSESSSDESVSSGEESGSSNQIEESGGELTEKEQAALERAYGIEKGARQKFEEASSLRKEVDEFLDNLQNGDFSLLEQILPEDTLLKFAEGMLQKKIDWEETPAETKARIQAERERDQLRAELEEYSKKEQEQILEYANNEASEELDNEITDVLEELSEKHGNIVKSPEFVQDVARIMLAQLEEDGQVHSGKAAKLALKNWDRRIGSYVSYLGKDRLPKYLSKSQLSMLRDSELDTALEQFPSARRGSEGKAPRKREKKMNIDDYFSKIEKKLG